MNIRNRIHIVQAPEWTSFKSEFGTKAVKVDDITFTKHKFPFLPYYVGYAPRVNFFEQKFDLEKLKRTAMAENCIVIRFDVPNVLKADKENSEIQNLIKHFVKSPRSTFATANVLMDISSDLDKISEKFTQKGRYNIKLAQKKGVTVIQKNDKEGLKIFYDLLTETGKRQNFLPHSYRYYEQAFEKLHNTGCATILIAYYENQPLTAWMLFHKDGILYYPFGASSSEHKNLMASDLVVWEAIRFGKEKGCTLFDMWGATTNEKSNWWGFTQFKLKFGGELIEYIDSYDFVINPALYNLFNFSYNLFWKVRKLGLKFLKI